MNAETGSLRSISQTERDTGITRDTLRMWERRYGFPTPVRNEKGERLYPPDQVERLRMIRILLDRGERPGKVVALEPPELRRQLGQAGGEAKAPAVLMPLLEAISRHQTAVFEQLLRRQYRRLGLERFVIEIVAPLLTEAGNRWSSGRMEVFEEHLLSRRLSRFLDSLIERSGAPEEHSGVLLATPPGEPHSLGLTMVEALLRYRHIAAINLGTEITVDQLLAAARRADARVIALSMSAAYPTRALRQYVRELRRLAPPEITLWIGGAGAARIGQYPPGILPLRELAELPKRL